MGGEIMGMYGIIDTDVIVDENIFKNIYTDRIEFFYHPDESIRVVYFPTHGIIDFYYSDSLIKSDTAHSIDDAVSQTRDYINDL